MSLVLKIAPMASRRGPKPCVGWCWQPRAGFSHKTTSQTRRCWQGKHTQKHTEAHTQTSDRFSHGHVTAHRASIYHAVEVMTLAASAWAANTWLRMGSRGAHPPTHGPKPQQLTPKSHTLKLCVATLQASLISSSKKVFHWLTMRRLSSLGCANVLSEALSKTPCHHPLTITSCIPLVQFVLATTSRDGGHLSCDGHCTARGSRC